MPVSSTVNFNNKGFISSTSTINFIEPFFVNFKALPFFV